MVVDLISDEGIILQKRIVKEKDLLFKILSMEHGLLTAIGFSGAKSRKRIGGKGEKFSHVRFQAKIYNSYISIEDISLIDPHENLLLSLEKIALSELITEIILKSFPEGKREPAIFNFLLQVLKEIEKKENPQNDFPLQLFNLLILEGYTVPPEKCRLCGKSLTTAFFIPGEGFVCPACFKKGHQKGIYFTENEVTCLQGSEEWCSGTENLLDKIIRIWETIIEKPLRSKQFLAEFIK